MDVTTASYYRAILYQNSTDDRPIPATLVLFHAWAFKRFQTMVAGSIISKQCALSVAMMWMSSTKEGRAFALEHEPTIGELFCDQDEATVEDFSAIQTVVNWDAVPAETKVVVTIDQKPTVGEFIGRRGGWVDVRVAGVEKAFRSSQVQLAGA